MKKVLSTMRFEYIIIKKKGEREVMFSGVVIYVNENERNKIYILTRDQY